MSQFNNFSIQNLNNQEMKLQRQIEALTSQLQQTQALRTQAQQFQQNAQQIMQPPQQKQNVFNIIPVDNFDDITANDVPMENGAFFILNDGKEIQYRHWSGAGEIIKSSYFPQNDNNPNKSTHNEEKSKNEVSDEFTEVFQEQLNTLVERMDKIEQVLSQKPTKTNTKSTSKIKKENDVNENEQTVNG